MNKTDAEALVAYIKAKDGRAARVVAYDTDLYRVIVYKYVMDAIGYYVYSQADYDSKSATWGNSTGRKQ